MSRIPQTRAPRPAARRIRLRLIAAATAACLAACIPSAARAAGSEAPEGPREAGTLKEALTRGKVGLQLRYRFESVSDDAPAFMGRDARASTLRTAFSYRTLPLRGVSFHVEFENVTDLGAGDRHNNAGAAGLANGVTDRPVIADPAGTEVNQAYLRYEGPAGTTVDLGRVQAALADERFVGPVGWRQNFQTFDGVRVRNTSLKRVSFTYLYVNNVNRINGGNAGMASHLLDVEGKTGTLGSAGAYVYRLDYDDPANAGRSTLTTGIRWRGKAEPGGPWAVPFHVEWARQRDTGDNPLEVDADYARVELGAQRGLDAGRIHLSVGWEVLGASPSGPAFGTPLATLHKFNGWADRFLATPPAGLEDRYLDAGWKRGAWTVRVVLHDFRADAGGADYGAETDALLSWRAPWGQVFAVKAASYDADTFSFDTRKFWAWTAWGF